jgi:two-component system, cell cycle response regulator DivK
MSITNFRPTLLLVEDHADTRQMYAEFLSATFDVLEAADGEEALELAQRHALGLVITDFSLPGMDGFELTRQLRVNAGTKHVPVICLSGYGGQAHERKAREVGCDKVLEKPCLPDLLARTARDMMQLGRAEV